MEYGEQLDIEAQLRKQIDAYHEAAMVFTAVVSGIPDLLKRGPRDADGLAHDLDLNAPFLRRFLRGLVTMKLCEELSDGKFGLTSAGASLALGSESNLREKIETVAGQYWMPWLSLQHCLETGEPSFPFIHDRPVDEWRKANPEDAAPFYRYLAKEEMKVDNADDLMQAFDVFEAETIASIGSGYGGFLIPFLIGFPELEAVVFDAPAVVEGAESMFQVYGLSDRVTFVGGDVLKSIPVEADIYVLKGVLQQHGDAEARRILKNCRKAMTPGARLIVYERLMPENAMDDPAAIMLDLHLMTIYGGKARTKAEMEALIAEAGLTVAAMNRTYEGLAFIEALPQ